MPLIILISLRDHTIRAYEVLVYAQKNPCLKIYQPIKK